MRPSLKSGKARRMSYMCQDKGNTNCCYPWSATRFGALASAITSSPMVMEWLISLVGLALAYNFKPSVGLALVMLGTLQKILAIVVAMPLAIALLVALAFQIAFSHGPSRCQAPCPCPRPSQNPPLRQSPALSGVVWSPRGDGTTAGSDSPPRSASSTSTETSGIFSESNSSGFVTGTVAAAGAAPGSAGASVDALELRHV